MVEELEKFIVSSPQPLKEEYDLLNIFYIKHNLFLSLLISSLLYGYLIPLLYNLPLTQNMNLSISYTVIFTALCYFRRIEKFFFYIFSIFLFMLAMFYFYDFNLMLTPSSHYASADHLIISIIMNQLLVNTMFFILFLAVIMETIEGGNFGLFKLLLLIFVSLSYALAILLNTPIYSLLWFPLILLTFLIFRFNKKLHINLEYGFKQVPFLPSAGIFALPEEIDTVKYLRSIIYQKTYGGRFLNLLLFLLEHILWAIISPFMIGLAVTYVSYKEKQVEDQKEEILNYIKSKEILRGIVFAEDVAARLKVSYSTALYLLNELELEGFLEKYWGRSIVYVDPKTCDQRILKSLIKYMNLAPSRKITPLEQAVLKILWIGHNITDISVLQEIIREKNGWELSSEKIEYAIRLLLEKGIIVRGAQKKLKERIGMDQIILKIFEKAPTEIPEETLEEKIRRRIEEGLSSPIIREKAFEYAINALEIMGIETTMIEPKFHLIYYRKLPIEQYKRKYLCKVALKIVKYIYEKVKSLPYVPGPPTDYIAETETTINVGGDCLEKSILIATLLTILGLKASIKILKNTTMHAVAITYIPYYGQIWLDPDFAAKMGDDPTIKFPKTITEITLP